MRSRFFADQNGTTEVQAHRFPNVLCTDRGRAINQMEPGWEKTLTGLPKEIYEFWDIGACVLLDISCGFRSSIFLVEFREMSASR